MVDLRLTVPTGPLMEQDFATWKKSPLWAC